MAVRFGDPGAAAVLQAAEAKAKQEQYMRDVAAALRQQANTASINNAWAQANPGQTSPNGTVYNPPSAAAPAAAPPAATPDAAPAPVAHDSAYNAAMDAAKRRRENAGQNLQYGLTRGANAYGLRAQVDPSSNNFTLAEVDPNSPDYNPFNQMALMRQHFEQSQKANKNSYAARGQLYAGALQNAQNDAKTGYNRDNNDLQTNFSDYIHNLISAKLDAEAGADDSVATAAADEAQRRIDNAAPATSGTTPAASLAAGVALPGSRSTTDLAFVGAKQTADEYARKINYQGPMIKPGQSLADFLKDPYFKTHELVAGRWQKKRGT